MNNELKKCNLCPKGKENHTSINTEVQPGEFIHVCSDCLEKTKDNFIFLCMDCGTVHIRNKILMINRIKDLDLKKAYMLCQDKQIIQGIDMCVSCNPEGIVDYMNNENNFNMFKRDN
jgi:hypothetical protein